MTDFILESQIGLLMLIIELRYFELNFSYIEVIIWIDKYIFLETRKYRDEKENTTVKVFNVSIGKTQVNVFKY